MPWFESYTDDKEYTACGSKHIMIISPSGEYLMHINRSKKVHHKDLIDALKYYQQFMDGIEQQYDEEGTINL